MSISKVSVAGSVALSPAMRYSSFPDALLHFFCTFFALLHFSRKQDIQTRIALYLECEDGREG